MQRFQWILWTALITTPVFASGFGCAESTTEQPPTGSTGSGGSSGSEATSSSSNASSSSGQGGSAGTAKVVINEIQATSEDWVEIVNIGDAVADLSGFGLADQDTDGTPKIADAVHFVDGAHLVPGEYLLIVANKSSASPGVQTDCLKSGGPKNCYQATWGISGANGDKIFLLTPTNDIVDEAAYPVNAVLDGQSYCRLPNGIGAFTACKPTPAEINAAP